MISWQVTVPDVSSLMNSISPEPFVLLSDEDLSVIKHIPVPFAERKIMRLQLGGMTTIMSPSPVYKTENGFILSEFSTDTVYRLNPEDDALTPVMVRTPAVAGMEIPVNLIVGMETGTYFFIQTAKLEADSENWDNSFPKTYLIYDKKSGEIYSQKFTDANYGGQKSYTISPPNTNNAHGYPPRTAVFGLQAIQLIDDYEAGNLSGKLKEVAAGLKEDDNPVIMIVTFR